ncbi:hypothetical protein DDE74_12795 [Streptomyces lydicus]|uniref:Uncharacterized protein n=1 Tax=Streptomyces lydicus TaxID=47763 RepID=A0A3S9Y9S1_9ACTN|nr:DUF6596 domain-containing protein [Streptomyces lydicus]AZS71715.1 hypothetical protein DDE74_12795 [Streptomyces lydicus]
MDEALLRSLTPSVLAILVRRGADFAAAEDAVQDALVEAVRVWPAEPPRDPKGWLVTVAWRKFLDAPRADSALMLLHHARRAARTAPDGSLVPLAEQDRGRWDTGSITEGVEILQAALARDRLGEFQAQAAIAALHADAPTAEETDWVQIVEWYDELARLTDSPVVRLNRAVAVGEADGPRAGLAALATLDDALPRHTAVAAYLHERDGDLTTAARLYAEAAQKAPNLAERDHLTRQAARLNARRSR